MAVENDTQPKYPWDEFFVDDPVVALQFEQLLAGIILGIFKEGQNGAKESIDKLFNQEDDEDEDDDEEERL